MEDMTRSVKIFSIAFGERYANWYENGRFVWLNKAQMAKVFKKYLEEALDQICQKCGFFCTVDPDYERGQIVINVVSE